MPKRGVAVFLSVAVIGLAAFLVVGATDRRTLAFTLGVVPGGIAAELNGGRTVCQTPINVPEDFSQVQFQVGTYGRPGPPLEVSVRSAQSGRRLAGGQLAGGYPDVSRQVVPVGRVERLQAIEVCLRNAGTRRVALYGNSALAAAATEARVAGDSPGTDLTLIFLRSEPQSLVSMAPDLVQRASVFRPEWVGAWTFWLLAALVLVAVPVMLSRAIGGVEDRPPRPG